jgi:hypothetical protein
MVAVVVAGELPARAAGEIPEFLRRVELETHAAGPARRLWLVAIVIRGQLPAFPGGASSDMTLTSIWWWARIARWDVAAHVAGLAGQPGLGGVLSDVRAESIVELARWDLDLAERLAAAWSGKLGELPSLLETGPAAAAGGSDPRTPGAGLRPPGPQVELWDERVIDGWHGGQSVTARSLAATPDRLNRVIWAAQARVLLPWIEERRSALLVRVSQTLGAGRLAAVLRDGFNPPVKADALVEIGVLDKLVQMVIGSGNPDLRDASRRLRKARNCLSHLEPLSLAEQESLVAACACL